MPKHAPRRHQDRPSGPRTAPGRPKTPAPGGYRTTPKRIKNAPSSPRLPRARAPGLGSASPSLPDLGRFLAYMGQPGKWRTIGPMTMNMDEPMWDRTPPDELHISGGIRGPSGAKLDDFGGGGWVGRKHKISKSVPLISPRLSLRAPRVKYMCFRWFFGSPGPGDPQKTTIVGVEGGGGQNQKHENTC